MAVTFDRHNVKDIVAKATRAAAELKSFAEEKPTIGFGALLQDDDEAWDLVPTLVHKGYRGQSLAIKLNELLGLPEGGLTRAVVTKAIRYEAWRRRVEAEKAGETEALETATSVIETLGLRDPSHAGATEAGQPAAQAKALGADTGPGAKQAIRRSRKGSTKPRSSGTAPTTGAASGPPSAEQTKQTAPTQQVGGE
jgi:hypothetical protein